MWEPRDQDQPFRDGVPGMCQQPILQMISYSAADRRKIEEVVNELRNEFLDHDGRVISTSLGMISCVGCSEETVRRMRAFVDARLPRPTDKPH